MKLTVNYIKNCKPVDSRLLEKIDEILDEISTLDNETNPEEYFGFELNGIKYDVFQIDRTKWSDEGKYQYRQDLYQLVSYDDSIRPYVCDKSIVNCFNCFFEVAVTRSGSYFSDYMYWYEKPVMKFGKIKHVPEIVIPEHDEYELTETYIIDCRMCDKLNETGDACKVYGSDPKIATEKCTTDGFKEYYVNIE